MELSRRLGLVYRAGRSRLRTYAGHVAALAKDPGARHGQTGEAGRCGFCSFRVLITA